MARNILIFSDGTGQVGGISVEERRSNIYKLYRATRIGPDSPIEPAQQVAYYDAGLGSRPPSGGTIGTIYRKLHNFVSQATGFGLTTNIIDCYEMIIRLWRPGDRIFLFGFSRGAYTVRCLGGVLANCGVPTRLSEDEPMRYDSATARRIASRAVKKVYQHTASWNPRTASARKKELLAQRRELARRFQEKHGVDLDNDKSHYPCFIGVFDTVAAVASKGSLIVVALGALLLATFFAWMLWLSYPAFTPWFGETVGNTLSWLFGLVGLDAGRWRHWFYFVLWVFGLGLAGWYLIEQVKFAPSANPKKPWRTLTMTFGPLRFDDKTLNDNVKFARHAIAIDENRSSFKRVGWGDAQSERPYQDEQGVITFRQYWFTGNHSDIGGSYPETESRLSDIALEWMIETAEDAADRKARKAQGGIKDGIKINHAVLQLHPSPGGMQHDERASGLPVLTRWLKLTWPEERRKIPNPQTTLHPSVYERMKLPAVLQYDRFAPYRPETLRGHEKLARFYKDIPEPPKRGRMMAYLSGFFLNV